MSLYRCLAQLIKRTGCACERQSSPTERQALLTNIHPVQALEMSTKLSKLSPPGYSSQNRNLHFRLLTSALSERVKSLRCPFILIEMSGIKRPCHFLPNTLFSLPTGVGEVPLWIAPDPALASLLRYLRISQVSLHNRLPWQRGWQDCTEPNNEEPFEE